MIPGPPSDPAGRLAWEVDRVADRLRSMSLARLARSWPPHVSVAAGARALAQALADRAARADGRPGRTVPDVGDAAVGDQVAVTGRDLLDSRASDDDLRAAADEVRAVRLTL